MTEKYAGSELLQMAIQLEKEGREFYLTAAKAVHEPVVKDIFQYLADEEHKHEEIFRSMLDKGEDFGLTWPYDDYEMLLYFHSLTDTRVFPRASDVEELKKEIDNPASALHIALSFEKEAILFFSEIKAFVQPGQHHVIDGIIGEERKHIQKILLCRKQLNV